jgi:hypothetical protein
VSDTNRSPAQYALSALLTLLLICAMPCAHPLADLTRSACHNLTVTLSFTYKL